MNVPFSPVWLWPVVIGMVVGAIFWRRWQKRAFLTAAAEDWPKHAPRGWKNVRILPWFVAVAGVIGAYSLWRFSAPSVHGRVVDGATGNGIPGALVARKVYRAAQVSLTEGPSVFGELLGRVQTRTDSLGRFRLPGYVSLFPVGIRGESGLAWKVFAQGYMIAGGCEQEGFRRPHGCGGDGGFSYPDRWVATQTKFRLNTIRLEVRLTHPVPGPGDPLDEYFRRLNLLVQYRYIDVEEFVKESVAFSRRHELTSNIRSELTRVRGSLGYAVGDGTYFKPDQALRLLEVEQQYCMGRSDEKGCDASVLARDRAWLEEKIKINER
jgi:hypothetical protein